MEWKQERRQKSVLGGLLIYVFSTVFVIYQALHSGVEATIWNALLWIVLLFITINAAGKSFLQQHRGEKLWYYSHISAQELIVAKLIYSSTFVLCLGLVSYFIFNILFAVTIAKPEWFILSIILGSIGFASTITFVSSIASVAGGSFTTVSVLSFPVIMPLIITQIKLSLWCINPTENMYAIKLSIVLMMLIILICLLAYMLFPYLWRD